MPFISPDPDRQPFRVNSEAFNIKHASPIALYTATNEHIHGTHNEPHDFLFEHDLTSQPYPRTHMLVRRSVPINSSSLTFGFAFMGILLIMLVAASLLQRHIARRERAERLRLGLDFGELENGNGRKGRRPEMWEVCVDCTGEKGSKLNADEEWKGDLGERPGKGEMGWRWKWADVKVSLAPPSFAFLYSS
jgi:hypothetical protein